MDDLIAPLLIFLAVAGLGWIVGIVGFFRAGRALRELDALRGAMPQPTGGRTAPVAPPVAAPPFGRPWPEMPAPQAPATVEQPPPPPPVPVRKRRDIEELITAKWGVWLGAAALMLAGVFLVRYASDQGLLGPGMRCLAMLVLAAALLGLAEWLHRGRLRASTLPDYAPQALAAGAVGILLGAAYLAGVIYELVPAPIGFALMAAASVAGLVLSLRFGQLVAAVGIVGGFVTPALVQTDAPSLPGLFVYLLCLTAAALTVVRVRAWIWLSWATTIAGAAWVLLVTLGMGARDDWAAALFVPAAAVLNLALLPSAALDHPVGRRLGWVPVAALGFAGLLLALADPGIATRGGVLLLAPITVARGAREPRQDRLPFLAAGLFLLLILFWGLPDWQATGETISVGAVVEAVLPGAWAPAALLPLLQSAAAMAVFFAAAGLWFERRCAHPLRWATLASAMPVVALAILYVRVKQFQPDLLWAAGALGLAFVSTFAATLAVREGDRRRAGVHAAGATAALALGAAMLLSHQWLTLAFVLYLPALALIEAQVALPQLRVVAIAVAALALVRLLANPSVLGYALDEHAVRTGLLPVYLVAAIAFAGSARIFRRHADDLAVAVLELGAAAFATALALIEIRSLSTAGAIATPESGFREIALDLSALAGLALLSLRLQERSGRSVLALAWGVQGGLALLGGIALILVNPGFIGSTTIGAHWLVNALLPAYAVPACVAALAMLRPLLTRGMRRSLAVYALVAMFVWITLVIRHAYHPDAMTLDDGDFAGGELWAYSGAWLAYGLALMAAGVVAARKPLRLAALAIVALAGAKIFLVDMAGLVGLWRVLSFLGLGLTLIALGAVYRRFVATPQG